MGLSTMHSGKLHYYRKREIDGNTW